MASFYLPVGTETGTASSVAKRVAEYFVEQGHEAVVDEQASVATLNDRSWDGVLVVTSTTGQGDIPGNLMNFYCELEAQFPLQNGRPFGVISLGDSSYHRTFCQGGALLEERFFELQAKAPVPRITIDATETRYPSQDALYFAKEWLIAVTQ